MTDSQQTSSSSNESSDESTSKRELSLIIARTFAPDELQNAVSAIQEATEICAENSIAPIYSFDPAAPLDPGMSISIIPLTKLVKGTGRIITGVTIAAHPSYDLLSSTSAGLDWIKSLVNKTLHTVIKSAASKGVEDQTSIPASVSDFISTPTRSTNLVGFNTFANTFVKLLKKQAPQVMSFLTKQILKEVLSNAQFATQVFPRIEQKNWELVLNTMIKQCEKSNIDAGVLQKWLQTRDKVAVETAEFEMTHMFDEMQDSTNTDTNKDANKEV